MTTSELELYGFQLEDYKDLLPYRSRLLGSEMGTGKTPLALKLDLGDRQKESNKGFLRPMTLVVCLKSGVENTWLKHYREWAPQLKVITMDPKNRDKFTAAIKARSHDIYICHWEGLRLERKIIHSVYWLGVIADEAQKAKNTKSQVFRALQACKTKYKTAITGTPADDKPQDMRAILYWLYPNFWLWKDESVFRDTLLVYDWNEDGTYRKYQGIQKQMLPTFHKAIRPFYRRHLKKGHCCSKHPEGVAPQMPDKTYRTIYTDLTPEQRKAYNQMRDEFVAWIGEHEDTPLVANVAVSQLIRLQQFACGSMELIGYKEVKNKDGEIVKKPVYRMRDPSSKIDAIEDILDELGEDRPVVVFTQFKQFAYLLANRLRARKIDHALFTGDTSPKDRYDIVQRFQAGRLRVFIGTIAAGGTGLDLYRASTVVFADRSWSPSANKQAEDRLWRFGQKNAVEVIDLVARSTIENGRLQKIGNKWEDIRLMVGDIR